MQPTTHTEYKVNSNTYRSGDSKGIAAETLLLIQLFLLGKEPVGSSLAV